MSTNCEFGCCGVATTTGCSFSDQNRSCLEFACSAGGGNPAGMAPACFEGAAVPTLEQLKQVWAGNNCPVEYSNILFTDTVTGDRQYNPEALAQVQADLNNLLTTYTVTYGKDFTSRTSSAAYDPFQEQLIGLCNNTDAQVPGACDLFLQNYCNSKTLSEIENDGALAAMCGCYVDSSQGVAAIDAAGGRACEPLCHLIGTVPQASPATGALDTCSNTVCVISDVNINLVGGSSSGTGTTFQQLCPSCTAANPCSCIISGVNITQTASQLNPAGANGVTYQQACGNNALCYNTTATGAVPTQCPEPSTLST